VAGRQLKTLNQYFDDLEVGDFFISRSRTLTETDIVMFSGLSGDYSPHHTDAEFAKTGPFGTIVAHGALTLAMATGLEFSLLGSADKIVGFYGMDRVRFVSPVPAGTTLHIYGTVQELTPKADDRGIVSYLMEIRDHEEKVCVSMIKKSLNWTREHSVTEG